ncbi:hypothetical protein Tco_1430970 [Tanacetum coccineum]
MLRGASIHNQNQKHQDHPSGKLLEMKFLKMLELDPILVSSLICSIVPCPIVSIPLCLSRMNYLQDDSSILNGCMVLDRIVAQQVLDMVVDEPLESE